MYVSSCFLQTTKSEISLTTLLYRIARTCTAIRYKKVDRPLNQEHLNTNHHLFGHFTTCSQQREVRDHFVIMKGPLVLFCSLGLFATSFGNGKFDS